MPLYTYQCMKCDNVFETLVMGAEKASCPACRSRKLDRLISAPSPPPASKAIIKAARAQAHREGHMSNYSKPEQKRLRQGKSKK